MDPGRLNQRVTIQQRSVTRDASGQDVITWIDLYTSVPAQVLPLRGREFFAAAQVQQEQSIKVRLRYKTGITTTQRLVWDGRNHDITGVIQLEGRKEWLELVALQGVKDGR